MRLTPLITVLFLILAPSINLADDVPYFQPLGILPGFVGAGAVDATPDGTVAVGGSWRISPLESEAFRWDVGGGMVGLGDLPGGLLRSTARGVSANGDVIVGYATHGFPRRHAFRWTPDEGMVDMGDLPGGIDESEASDVSADGSVIVGFGSRNGADEAFRWTAADGMVGLGYAPDYRSSWASAISSDGNVIVGSGDDGYGSRQAYRWTAQSGMVLLGDLPGGTWPFESHAFGVSADGGIVVGRGQSSLGYEAMRWTAEDGMIGLGDLPGGGFDSAATSVTADGSIIIGQGETDLGEEAFLWNAEHGMRKLSDALHDNYGLNLDGWTLMWGNITDGGDIIVGGGTNPSGQDEAFIVRIPEPQSLLLTLVGVATLGATRRVDSRLIIRTRAA